MTQPAAPARYLYVRLPRELRDRRIRIFGRREFLTRRFKPTPGQQLVMFAPSQDGKTTLGFQMLKYTLPRLEIPAYVIVLKPRDATPAMWSDHLGFLETPTWPPPYRPPWKEDPPGHTLWPVHTMNVDVDNANLTAQVAALLQYAYATGDCIVFADEIYGIWAELDKGGKAHIKDLCDALWSRGSGMGAGMWCATQKPAGSQGVGMPGLMISNAWHLLFSRDPDGRARDRYSEIGGVDPRLILAIIMRLERHQFLYINKGDDQGGPYLCIIDAS